MMLVAVLLTMMIIVSYSHRRITLWFGAKVLLRCRFEIVRHSRACLVEVVERVDVLLMGKCMFGALRVFPRARARVECK